MTTIEFNEQLTPASSEVVSDVERYLKLKQDRDDIQKEMDDITRWMSDHVTRTAVWDTEQGPQKVTVVRGVTRTVDLNLLGHISPDIYAAIVDNVPTLNRDKFNEARAKWNLFAEGTPERKALRETQKKASLSIGRYVPEMEAPDGE